VVPPRQAIVEFVHATTDPIVTQPKAKPPDKDGEPSAPEPSGRCIGRNNAEACGIGGEQEIADDPLH
jgi:hypothetical protein